MPMLISWTRSWRVRDWRKWSKPKRGLNFVVMNALVMRILSLRPQLDFASSRNYVQLSLKYIILSISVFFSNMPIVERILETMLTFLVDEFEQTSLEAQRVNQYVAQRALPLVKLSKRSHSPSFRAWCRCGAETTLMWFLDLNLNLSSLEIPARKRSLELDWNDWPFGWRVGRVCQEFGALSITIEYGYES